MRPYSSAEGMYAVKPNVAGQKRRTVSGMPCKTPVLWSFDAATSDDLDP